MPVRAAWGSGKMIIDKSNDTQIAAECGAHGLQEQMGDVLRQIAESERRHSALLAEVGQRLEMLGAGTRAARAQVPSAFLPGFEKIEDGMALIADRIAEQAAEYPSASAVTVASGHGQVLQPAGLRRELSADTEDPFSVESILSSAAPVANAVYVPGPAVAMTHDGAVITQAASEPQPLRSAAGHHRPLNGAYPMHVDPFDVVESLPGNPSEPWSLEGAAALVDLYASGQATFSRSGKIDTDPLDAEPDAAISDPSDGAAAAPEGKAGGQTLDRDWLEGRLTDIATRLERSLSERSHETAIRSMTEQLTALEARIAEAMAAAVEPAAQGVAMAALDWQAIEQIENQIRSLGVELNAARDEMERLRMIEEQIGVLMGQVSDERIGAIVGRAIKTYAPASPHDAGDRSENELQVVALAAAEAAVARMTQGGHGVVGHDVGASASDGPIDELRALIGGYIDERRQGDEQNAQAMDALQQAMLRVLDRLDAIEGVAPPADADPFDAGAYRPAYRMDSEAPVRAEAIERRGEPADRQAGHREAPRRDDRLEASQAPEAGAMQDDAAFVEDPIARQRAMLQASAKRAAIAQREKQLAEPAKKTGIVGKLAAAFSKRGKKPAAAGSGVMVSSLALAVALGFGATFMLTKYRTADGQLSAAAASAAPVSAASPAAVATTTASAAAGNGEKMPAEPAIRPATKPAAARPVASPAQPQRHIVPETVTELDGEGAIDGGGANTESGGSPRGELASFGAAPADLDGILFQATGETSALEPLRGEGPSLPINGAVGQPVPVSDGQGLDLPPATVGPLSMRIAAAKGDPSAEFEVGSRLAEGKGTDQNLKEAARWYQRAAAKGFVQAQYRLATLYERGLGVKADPARAKSWYQRAAEQGNVKSMHNLAVLAAGRSGGNPDYTSAATWFTQAANHGLADSQFNLGVLTESGLGVEKDRVQAAMWFILSAQAGDKEAIRRRDQMKARMDRNEWSAAEHLARSWQPIAPDKLSNDARYAGEIWKSRQAAAQ